MNPICWSVSEELSIGHVMSELLITANPEDEFSLIENQKTLNTSIKIHQIEILSTGSVGKRFDSQLFHYLELQIQEWTGQCQGQCHFLVNHHRG